MASLAIFITFYYKLGLHQVVLAATCSILIFIQYNPHICPTLDVIVVPSPIPILEVSPGQFRFRVLITSSDSHSISNNRKAPRLPFHP
jgi:hypothetical protein